MYSLNNTNWPVDWRLSMWCVCTLYRKNKKMSACPIPLFSHTTFTSYSLFIFLFSNTNMLHIFTNICISGTSLTKVATCFHPLSTQRLASFLIHLCLSCFFWIQFAPLRQFLKTYQFMWAYNSDIHKRYIWEFRPVKVIMNIVWHWKWATCINLFIWRNNHRAWFGSKCQHP